ncbi:hypothetical protein V8E52_005438 [Russula decolorans]
MALLFCLLEASAFSRALTSSPIRLHHVEAGVTRGVLFWPITWRTKDDGRRRRLQPQSSLTPFPLSIQCRRLMYHARSPTEKGPSESPAPSQNVLTKFKREELG